MDSLTQKSYNLDSRYVAALRMAASAQRFTAYDAVAGDDEQLACQLYLWDRDVQAAISRDIAIVEVALRNSMSRQFEHFLGSAWYASDVLERDKRLTGARDRAARELSFTNKAPTSALMTAQLSLGFWVNLLNSPSDQLWRSCLYKAFPGGKAQAVAVGQHYRRTWVLSILQTMRVLRNRCAHHEPLLRGFPLTGKSVRMTTANGIAAYMSVMAMVDRNLAEWMATDTATTVILAARPRA